MRTAINWKCPFCHSHTVIHSGEDGDRSCEDHCFYQDSDVGARCLLRTELTRCPNPNCNHLTIEAALHVARSVGRNTNPQYLEVQSWLLRPVSNAKTLPDYIPEAIRKDYGEACRIQTLSPNASATLSRRCLQGMIRDFWHISKPTLFAEIDELKKLPKIDADVINAIDSARSLGNIGAHMQRDTNLIIDVDEGEAALMLRLIETLFDEWYVRRAEREKALSALTDAARARSETRTP